MVVQQSGMACSRESPFGAPLQKFRVQYFFGPEVESHIIYEIYLLNLEGKDFYKNSTSQISYINLPGSTNAGNKLIN